MYPFDKLFVMTYSAFVVFKKSFRISNINNDQEPTLYSDKETNIHQSASTRLKSPKHETKCLIQENDIKFIQVIGRGAFGSVRSAEWTTQDNEKVIYKSCHRRQLFVST